MAVQAKSGSIFSAAELLRSKGASEVLAWADAQFGASAAIAASFGVGDVALIDLASRSAPRLRVFTLDTGRLPSATYEGMVEVRRRDRSSIEAYFPDPARVGH